MSSQAFSRPGAVDLSSLSANAGAESAGTPSGSGSYSIDVTDASFQADVLNRSMTVPVVIDFWATWCQPCKTLSPILERLADEYAGRFVLAKIDVDANPAIAQSAQVQSIPTVIAVLRGQAVPLFQGALPEADVRRFIDELLKVAVANGVAGRAEPAAPTAQDEAGAADEAGTDPRFDAAFEAINNGDFDAAAAAYRAVLAESPADADAKAGLAQVELLRRTHGVDARAASAAAEERPGDVDAQLLAADLEVANGRVDDAFARLVATVRRVDGDDRDRARTRLVELFEIVGPADPRVTKARAALASALF
jgi:putative thioredoxin